MCSESAEWQYSSHRFGLNLEQIHICDYYFMTSMVIWPKSAFCQRTIYQSTSRMLMRGCLRLSKLIPTSSSKADLYYVISWYVLWVGCRTFWQPSCYTDMQDGKRVLKQRAGALQGGFWTSEGILKEFWIHFTKQQWFYLTNLAFSTYTIICFASCKICNMHKTKQTKKKWKQSYFFSESNDW